jgi:hypothetical protein
MAGAWGAVPIKLLQATSAHHPPAPSSERRGVDELAPLLGKEGVGGGCCQELAAKPH